MTTHSAQRTSHLPSWRDAILNNFVPNVSKLTLVADPDCLLTEEKLALELRGRGFDLIEFSDPVEFRYAYESKYRSIWDRGEHTDLVVVLRLQDAELESLPYDLLQAGRKLSFNLGDLFPTLSYPVIEKLDRSLLDSLFEAQRKSPPDRMGDNATKDFILRHVFGIAAELIGGEVELLRALLRLHYGKLQLPLMLAERLIQVLKGHDGFKAWPLSEIVPDDEAFFAFLQERWPLFLARLGSAHQVREDSPEYGLKYPGPDRLPFDHQDIKVYIDNLFLEGKLTPVEAKGIEVDAGSWVRSGIATSGVDDDELRISRLFGLVEQELPTAEARYSDWTAFALKWAELSSLVHCGNSTEYQTRLREIGDALNATFAAWLADHYSSLINLPPTNPAMLHHVPRRLAREIEDSGSSRAALIVVDGLALDQWVTIRQLLQNRMPNLVMRESATFRLDSDPDLGIAAVDLLGQAAALFPVIHQLDQQRREALEAVLGRPWPVPTGCRLPARSWRRRCCGRPRLRNPPREDQGGGVGRGQGGQDHARHATRLGRDAQPDQAVVPCRVSFRDGRPTAGLRL